jgi:O-antigen/teichoic acid export membrane protein
MTYSHWLIPEQHNYFAWNKQASRELFSFGRWIFVSTAMAFLAGQADRLILGKLVSLELLGVYTIAFMFADLPRQVVGRLGSKLIFPLVSQHTALFQSINPSLLAIGKPFYGAYGNSLKLVYMIIGLPIAFSLMGVLGTIIVIAFNDLPVYGAVTYGMWREKLAVIEQDIQISLLLIVLISLVCTGRYLLGFGLPLEEIL